MIGVIKINCVVMKLCGPNKPILPVMPEEREELKFNWWASMQPHPSDGPGGSKH